VASKDERSESFGSVAPEGFAGRLRLHFNRH
jgi:hypothetical protein